MSWLDGWRHRLRTLLRPAAFDAELEEELRLHEELDAMHQGDAGAARRRFGNRTWYKEETRRMTWLGALDVVGQDLRAAWRGVAHAPGVTAMVVATLALGVGANAATFAVLDRLYLRPPGGVADAGTLRTWWALHFNTGDGVPFTSSGVYHRMFRAIAQGGGDSARVALYLTDHARRLGPGLRAPRVRVVYATHNYFPVLGVRAAAGRLFGADEDRLGSGASVAVISDRFLRHQFGGDAAAALGAHLPIGRETYTVVGVLDRAFTGLDLQASDVWIPLAAMPAPRWIDGPWWESPHFNGMRTVQRVDRGADPAPAEQRATALVRALNREVWPRRPDTLMTVGMDPLVGGGGKVRPGQDMIIATRLSGVAVVVLLIACANVINLLLARAVRRRREIAVRLALGISRARLVRLLILETLLLAGLACGAALLTGWWGGSLLRSLLLPDVQWYDAALDGRVALFTVAIALAAGLVAGVVPAVLASRPDLTAALKSGARDGVRRPARLRGALVAIQTALSLLLLVGAALFVRSLRNVTALDIGFDAGRLVFGRARFAEGEAPPAATLAAATRDIAARLARRPGVEAVARAGVEPMQGFAFETFYSGADSLGSFPGRMPTMSAVSPEFFRAAGIRLLRGSGFSGGDGDRAPAEVIVNEAMAAMLWPGHEPIGQCLRFRTRQSPCHTVVGVVENVRRFRVLETESPEQYYLPLGSVPPVAGGQPVTRLGTIVVVRAAAHATEAAQAELAAALREAFPAGEPVVTPMTRNLEPEYRPWRLGATLFTAFGVLALVVAVVGIYSTVSYGVSQRTHEFGVRIALGARLVDVLGQVVGQSLRVVAVGAAAGVLLALAAGRLIAALLYGVAADDPLVMAAVAAALLGCAALAALLPAWRAARTDPIAALRAD